MDRPHFKVLKNPHRSPPTFLRKPFPLPRSSEETTTDRKIENFPLVLFNVLYFMLQSPFRIRLSSGSGTGRKYEILTNKLHQGICLTIQTISLIIYFNELRDTFVSRSSHNPVEYLSMFLKATSFLHHIVFVHTIWTKGPQFLKVVEHLVQSPPNSAHFRPPHKHITLLLSVSYPALSILFTATQVEPQPDLVLSSSFLFRITSTFTKAQCGGGGGDVGVDNDSLHSKSQLLPLNLLQVLLLFFRVLMSYTTDLTVLLLILVVYYPSVNLRRMLRAQAQAQPLEALLLEYARVKELCSVVNMALDRLLLTFVAEGLFFYSVNMKELIIYDGQQCVWFQAWMGILFFIFWAVFYLSAEISSNIESVRVWVLEQSCKGTGLAQLELLSLKFDMMAQSSRSGLSGNGLFILNYSFLTTICSTLMTYFILSVQFRA